MLERLGVLVAIMAASFALSTRAEAWRQEIDGGRALAVTLSGGDVIAAGSIGAPLNARDFAVLRHDGATGTELWRYTRDGTGNDPDFDLDEGKAVAIDPMGDVVAAGLLHNTGTNRDFVVVKLAGGTGAEVWRVEIDGTLIGSADIDEAVAVAVDSAGDVIAAGRVVNAASGGDLLVVKLAAVTGTELWRVELDEGDFEEAEALVLDATGDVFIGGRLDGTATVLRLAGATGAELWRAGPPRVTLALALDAGGDVATAFQLTTSASGLGVAKLSGASGAEIWRNDVAGLHRWSNGRPDVTFDAAGDVVVGAAITSPAADTFPSLDLGVVKLAASTGAESWRQTIDGKRGKINDEAAYAVAVEGSGDVVAAGFLFNARAAGADLAVARLAGASGAVVWLAQVDESSSDVAYALALDAAGNPVAAGSLGSGFDEGFAVLRLAAGDGGIGPVRGKKLLVRDDAGNPDARKLVARLRDVAIVAPPPGATGDPTVSGATLRLVNPTTAETASLPLPAALWSGLGTPAGSRGWEYRDNGTAGPCRSLRVRSGQVNATCTGQYGAFPFTLDEPSQGSLTVSLELGTTEPQCTTFGGVIADAGTANPGPVGVFRAKTAPAALGDCP